MGLIYDPLPTYGCGDTFYDSGGDNSDYCGNENSSWLICPDVAGDFVTVTFNSFDVEGGGTCTRSSSLDIKRIKRDRNEVTSNIWAN